MGFLALVILSIVKCCKQLITLRVHSRSQELLSESTSTTSFTTEMQVRKGYAFINNIYNVLIQELVSTTEVKSWKRNTLIKRDHKTMRRENLLLMKKLGDGSYGAIYEAELYDSTEHSGVRKVVAKLLQSGQGGLIRKFEGDMERLSKLNHKHMVGLLAQFTQDNPKCYVMDCGQSIDLLEYIRNLKSKSTIHKLLQESSDPAVYETEEDESMIENAVSVYEGLLMDLLMFADHIVLGMAYLSSLNHVHKDLALRNCIIGYDNVVKVTIDTELARVRYPEVYFTDQPIRWMSPESLLTNTFTAQSDVWSYGVVLWELITLGDLPYSPIADESLISAVTTDPEFTLEKPMLCSENMFTVMTECWLRQPISRPSFIQLHEQIYKLTISS